MKLRPSVKKWLRALRSGKYKQTDNHLRDSTGYCCLGVACDLAVKEGIIGRPKKSGDLYGYEGEEFDFLPEKVRSWLGLRSRRGSFKKNSSESTLSTLNDQEGYSFKEIADVIESAPEGLFS